MIESMTVDTELELDMLQHEHFILTSQCDDQLTTIWHGNSSPLTHYKENEQCEEDNVMPNRPSNPSIKNVLKIQISDQLVDTCFDCNNWETFSWHKK